LRRPNSSSHPLCGGCLTVTDHNEKTILGLDAGHFAVFDDQKQQPIVFFSSDDSPCSVGVILDISGSMRSAKQPRRAMLVLSDGMDNHSRYSKNELMRVALEADVQVYAVIVDNPSTEATMPFRPAMIKKPGDQAQEAQGRSLLEDLSDKTGGIHFRLGKADEAEQAAAKIGAAIRNEYIIGYLAPAADPTGKWHRIRVKSDVLTPASTHATATTPGSFGSLAHT
jgi:Ca-activated chloride channel homolog